MRATLFLGTLALWIAANPAFAGDGVLEINQTCALLTGCFPGDAAQLPVTIGSAGRYRLTSNLTVNDANLTAIAITPGVAVDLDLNGFSIIGGTACSGIPAQTCGPSGSGIGVSGGNDVRVHDGHIRGMGSHGISLTWSARVEDVLVQHNAGAGIRVGQASYVRGSQAASNGEAGIDANLEARILDNEVSGNALAGIKALGGVVTGNSSARNGGAGGEFGPTVAFSGNSFASNAGGSLVGGAPTGGNVCDDAKCTRDGARRYYLTPTFYNGIGAINACASGFHMASLSEIHSNVLRYDLTLGAHSPFDQGSGAPRGVAGWIRTGAYLTNPASVGVGAANCQGWTASSGVGTYVMWGGDLWADPATTVSPWKANVEPCSSPLSVWCVEN